MVALALLSIFLIDSLILGTILYLSQLQTCLLRTSPLPLS
jgi:hypothetical protein